jgi:prepilin-type N-terminal cleavage/methylation domain-containing protein
MKRNAKAFSLIELLIVVAIIAILAAIAVPNFLEAQTRAKVSRVKADFRALAVGLESYQSDWDHYPVSYAIGNAFYTASIDSTLFVITTPVAYMTSVSYPDPFGIAMKRVENINSATLAVGSRPMYMYFNYEVLCDATEGHGKLDQWEWSWRAVNLHGAGSSHRAFMLWGPGPDRTDSNLYWADTVEPSGWKDFINLTYDPTNGTVSKGDMGRLGGAYNFKPLMMSQ